MPCVILGQNVWRGKPAAAFWSRAYAEPSPPVPPLPCQGSGGCEKKLGDSPRPPAERVLPSLDSPRTHGCSNLVTNWMSDDTAFFKGARLLDSFSIEYIGLGEPGDVRGPLAEEVSKHPAGVLADERRWPGRPRGSVRELPGRAHDRDGAKLGVLNV